jgi:hypothetical protein
VLPVTAAQDALWDDDLEPEPSPRGFPDLTPAPDYLGLKVGDRIQMSWTDASAPVPAEVIETTVFGALVTVDPTGDSSWACGPFDMYVTQQCADGTWAR